MRKGHTTGGSARLGAKSGALDRERGPKIEFTRAPACRLGEHGVRTGRAWEGGRRASAGGGRRGARAGWHHTAGARAGDWQTSRPPRVHRGAGGRAAGRQCQSAEGDRSISMPCTPAAFIPRLGTATNAQGRLSNTGKYQIWENYFRISRANVIYRTFRNPARHRDPFRPAPGSEVPFDILVGPPAIRAPTTRFSSRGVDLPPADPLS